MIAPFASGLQKEARSSHPICPPTGYPAPIPENLRRPGQFFDPLRQNSPDTHLVTRNTRGSNGLANPVPKPCCRGGLPMRPEPGLSFSRRPLPARHVAFQSFVGRPRKDFTDFKLGHLHPLRSVASQFLILCPSLYQSVFPPARGGGGGYSLPTANFNRRVIFVGDRAGALEIPEDDQMAAGLPAVNSTRPSATRKRAPKG